MKNKSYIAAAAFGALLVSTSMANAAGFFIQEQSVSAGGSAYAGAASSTKDASTIFFNPAGMTQLDGAQANLGVQLLLPDSDLEDTGSDAPGALPDGDESDNPYDPSPVPSAYIATPVSRVDGLWLGLGVSNPFGLTSEYDDDWFGRYDSIKTDLTITDIQPSIAYDVNDWLSVGGGLNFAFANAELTSAFFAGAGAEGTSKLKGNDWGFGYTLGTQIKPTPTTTVGLNYRSSLHFDLDGSIDVEGTGIPIADGTTDAKAGLATPDIASIGVTQELNSKWKVMGQVNWFGWNNFNDILPISDAGAPVGTSVVQNYQTSLSYALGAEYMYSPEWTFRGGIQYDRTPTTDEYRTTRTPDGDRTWFSAGATYQWNERISIDGLLTYIHIQDQEIDVTRVLPGPDATVSADTEGSVGIVGLGLNYKF